MTGLTFVSGAEMGGKLLELFRETVPHASRIATLWNPTNPMHPSLLRESESGRANWRYNFNPLRRGVSMHSMALWPPSQGSVLTRFS
jgi:hypothetical protein